MFCTKCGSEIEEGARFCTKCGAVVEEFEDAGYDAYPAAAAGVAPDAAATQVMGTYQDQAFAAGEARYAEPQFAQSDPTQSPVYYVPAQAPEPKKKGRGALIAVLCILAAAAVGAAVFFGLKYFNGNGGSATATQSSATTSANGQNDGTAPANAANAQGSSTTQPTSQDTGGPTSGTVTNNQVPSTSSSSSNSTQAGSASSSGSQNAAIPSSNPYSQYTADYILPDSSSRTISQSDISGLNKNQLRIARNEIYARHGRMFNDADLQEYFNSKHWYHGTIAPDNFDENQYLSDTERKNAETIRAYEQSMGYL